MMLVLINLIMIDHGKIMGIQYKIFSISEKFP